MLFAYMKKDAVLDIVKNADPSWKLTITKTLTTGKKNKNKPTNKQKTTKNKIFNFFLKRLNQTAMSWRQ